MKRTIFGLATILVVFVAIFAVLALRPVAKVKATGGQCWKGNQILKGPYAVVAPGLNNYYYNEEGWNFSMIATFNGNVAGTFSGTHINAFTLGVLVAGSPDSFTNTGTYTVNSDCSCTLNFPALAVFGGNTMTAYGVLVDTGGDEVIGNWSSLASYTKGTFDAKKIACGRWIFWD